MLPLPPAAIFSASLFLQYSKLTCFYKSKLNTAADVCARNELVNRHILLY